MSGYSFSSTFGGNVDTDGSGLAGELAIFDTPNSIIGDPHLTFIADLLTVTGDIKGNRLAIGAGSIFDGFRFIDFNNTITDLSAAGTYFGSHSTFTETPAADTANNAAAHRSLFTISGIKTSGTAIGFWQDVLKTSSGTASGNMGFLIQAVTSAGTVNIQRGGEIITNCTGGTVTENIGLEFRTTRAGGGVIPANKYLKFIAPVGVVAGNHSALYFEDQGAANYSIKSLGGLNYYAGVSTFAASTNHLSTLVGPILASGLYSLTGLAQPYLGYDSTNYGALEVQGGHGGLQITGLSNSDKTGLLFNSIIGATTTVNPGMSLTSSKSDGAGGTAPFGALEIVYQVNNGGVSPLLNILGNGALQLLQNGGLFVGSLSDPTHANFLSLNQFDFQVTAPLSPGDPYLQNVSTITGIKLLADQLAFTISGHGAFTFTDPTNTHPYAQLIGGQYTTQHDGAGNVDDCWAAAYSVHNVGAANATRARAGNFVYANLGAGTITNAVAVYIENPNNDGSNNNITNAYGIFIEDQSKGTNKWAIKTGLGKVDFGDTLVVAGSTGIGINVPNAVSILDLTSTTKGFLPPRMTTVQRNAIVAVEGLIVYDTTIHGVFVYDNTNWVQL